MTGGINAFDMRKLGYTVLKKDENGNDIPEIDWDKTTAFTSSYCHIFINLKGREPHGIVDPADKYELEEKIMTDLYSLHLSAETEAFIDDARRVHADVRTVPSGSSIKICLVAEGTADVYPRLAPTMEWDTAAGHAVVRAAGGDIVEAGSGATLRYNKRDLTNPYFIVRRDANAPQS